MTKEEFVEKIKIMWKEIDKSNFRMEMLIQVVEIENDSTIHDLIVESSSCILCQSDMLLVLIENQQLEHCDESQSVKEDDEPKTIH